MKTENYIGKELLFDQDKYNAVVNVYERMVPVINDIAKMYETFSLGTFNQEIYFDILRARNANKLQAQYEQKVAQSIEKMQMPSPSLRQMMTKQAASDAKQFSDKVEKLFQAYTTFAYSPFLNGWLPANLEDIAIVDGKAMVTDEMKEKLKKKFTAVIETANQAKVYELCLGIKKEYDALAEYLERINNECEILPLAPPVYHNTALLVTDESNRLQFVGENIDMIV